MSPHDTHLNAPLLQLLQISSHTDRHKPKFHLARRVTSRLDTTRHVRRVILVARVVASVTRRACSNMADDKEAVVLACTS